MMHPPAECTATCKQQRTYDERHTGEHTGEMHDVDVPAGRNKHDHRERLEKARDPSCHGAPRLT